MTFYLQHGYGKSSKIQDVDEDGHLRGVVLSPADEDVTSLSTTVAEIQRLGLRALMDPQSYVYSLNPTGSGRKHESHGLQMRPMHWAADAKAVDEIVGAVSGANAQLGLEDWIAPTCVQSTFGDLWTPLAVQFARASSEAWGSRRTIVSIVIEEAALSDWMAVADWLDVATTLDVSGFYIIVQRARRDYPTSAWDVDKLANLLRIIYRLSIINEYEVIWGYADIDGLVGLAAGADGIASGWHYSLRTANKQKWQPSDVKGGQPPAPRIYVPRLWAALRADPEGLALYRSRFQPEIFRGSLGSQFRTDSDLRELSRLDAQLQHLTTLARLAERVVSFDQVSDRVTRVVGSLRRAENLYAEINSAGVLLAPSYLSKVSSLLKSVEKFAEDEKL